jgi:hypothetical protein
MYGVHMSKTVGCRAMHQAKVDQIGTTMAAHTSAPPAGDDREADTLSCPTALL